MPPNQLDPNVVAAAKALRQTETGDSKDPYTQKGQSGEFGAYQFMPATYKNYAQKYLGNADAPPTVENQNKIAYSFIKEKKDEGYNPAQIASMWNAGEGKPDAYKEGFSGTNAQGVHYDTPAYVAKFSANYQQFKQALGVGGTPTAQAAEGGRGSVPILPIEPSVLEQQQQEASTEEKPSLAKRLFSALLGNEKNFGESIAGAILPYTAAGKQFDQAQQQSLNANKQYIDIVLARLQKKRAAGEDTSKEEEQLRNSGMTDIPSTADFNPASQKTAKQVIGEAVGVGADILSGGTYGKAAEGLKTGALGKAVAPNIVAPLTRSEGILRGAAQGIGVGGAYGAVQGGARAAQENQDASGIAGNALLGGATGAALGGVLGAGAGAVSNVRGKVDPTKIIKNRYDELANIQKNNAVVRRVIEAGDKRGIDTKKILAENDFLVGAVDKDGTIDTTNAIAEMQDFLSPIEGTVRANLERDGKMVSLDEVKKALTGEVRGSGIKGSSLTRALKQVDDDIAGYALEANGQGQVPLTLLHDAKVDKYQNLNYLNPESSRIDKTVAKGLKKFVEQNTDSIDVKAINKELSDYFATMSVLEKLNGKKVKAGRLGKYFAQTVGSIVGGHFGPLGSIVGAELGGGILGKSMASKFGPKIGSRMAASPELLDAAALAKMPPVRKVPVKDLGTNFTDELPTIEMGTVPRKQDNLPVIEFGQSESAKSTGSRQAHQTKTKASTKSSTGRAAALKKKSR